MITKVDDYKKWLSEAQNLGIRQTKIQLQPETELKEASWEEKYFDIDLNTRTINVPYQYVAVEGDVEAETIYFRVDRFFDNQDLFPFAPLEGVRDANEAQEHVLIGIHYVNAQGQQGFDFISNASVLESNQNVGIIPWTLSKNVAIKSGIVTFALVFFKLNYVDARGLTYTMKDSKKTYFNDNDYLVSNNLITFFLDYAKGTGEAGIPIDGKDYKFDQLYKLRYGDEETEEGKDIETFERLLRLFLSSLSSESVSQALEEYSQYHAWRGFEDIDDPSDDTFETETEEKTNNISITSPLVLVESVSYTLNTRPATFSIYSGLNGNNFDITEEETEDIMSNIYKTSELLYNLIHGQIWVPRVVGYTPVTSLYDDLEDIFNDAQDGLIKLYVPRADYIEVKNPLVSMMKYYYEKNDDGYQPTKDDHPSYIIDEQYHEDEPMPKKYYLREDKFEYIGEPILKDETGFYCLNYGEAITSLNDLFVDASSVIYDPRDNENGIVWEKEQLANISSIESLEESMHSIAKKEIEDYHKNN